MRVTYCTDPERDLTPDEQAGVRLECGEGWTDDLDFAVIVQSGHVVRPAMFGRANIGSMYQAELLSGRTVYLFTHA